MGIAILGPLTVDGAGPSLSPRDRVVLSALAIQPGQAVPAEQLADALWGDAIPASAAKVVQGCILRLRRAIGATAIETTSDGYVLRLSVDEIDGRRFERLVARARHLLAVGEPDRARSVAGDALLLWRGRPLEDLSAWETGRVEAARLDDLRLDAEDLQVDAELRAGRFDAALAVTAARVAAAPLRERRWFQHALAQYRVGRQGEALATLREARATFVRELGLDPGPELVELEDAILRHDPSLSAPAAPNVDAKSPYPGLVPLGPDDADAFFGRDTEVDECLRRLDRDGVIVIVGPSGSGKSSLVQAGIAPRLRESGGVGILTPGPHPLAALTAAVRSLPPAVAERGSAPTLVIDQCEEAVTLCDDVDERAAFFSAIVERAASQRLVIAMRADRMGDFSTYPGVAALVESHLFLITAMSDDNLRRIIQEPARRAGLLLEPGLVDLLIRDVEDEPGSLPLLAHALRQTWERREGRTLTVAGYRASGGIRMAVAQSAEEVFTAAPPEQQLLLRELMLRLVSLSENGEPSRARVARRSLFTDIQHEQLIETLVRARLLTSDDKTVEIAHEALIRAWPRLREWLAEDADGQRIRAHLTDSTAAWEALGRPESELYRGIRLAEALDWRERSGAATTMEAEFLDAALVAESDSLRHAENEARHQRRNNRRLVVAIAGVAALAVAATTFGVVAADQARRADVAAGVARAQELAASSVSALDADPSLAALLAVSSAQAAEPDLRASAALHEALGVQNESVSLQPQDPSGWLGSDLSPDGTRMALGGVEPSGAVSRGVEVVDAATAQIVWTERLSDAGSAASAWVVRPLYSPDGQSLVWGVIWEPTVDWRIGPDEPPDQGSPDGLAGIYVRDASDGTPLQRIDVGPCGGYPLDVSATHVLVRTPASAIGARAGAATCEWRHDRSPTALELVDRATGARTLLTTDSGHPISQPAFSADGRFAAFEDATAGAVRVVDVATGAIVYSRSSDMARDVSGDGSLLLAGFDPVQVIDISTGEVVSTLDADGSAVVFAAFAPGDDAVFGSAWDSVVRGWDPATGKAWFHHPAAGVGLVSFADDGRVGVSYPEGSFATVLDPHARGEFGSIDSCSGWNVSDSAHAAAGVIAYSTQCDGDDQATTTLLDVATWKPRRTLPSASWGASLAPDGAQIARVETTAGHEDRVVVRDTTTGTVTVTLDDPCAADEPSDVGACGLGDARTAPTWSGLAWSPDKSAVAGILDDAVAVWDATTGRVRFVRAIDEGFGSFDLLFSPESAELFVSTSAGRVTAISASDGSSSRSATLNVDGSQFLGLIGFTADGSRLIAITRFIENAGASILWLDSDDFAVSDTVEFAHDASLRAAALSPDATQLATSSADGTARVWDVDDGSLLHEIPLGESIEGIAWAGEHRLALAPASGGLLQMSTDPTELLSLLQGGLTRGYSLTECQRYGFGPDCPSLADLGAQDRPDPSLAALNGVYRMDWDEDELKAALVAHYETTTGGALSAASTRYIEDSLPSYTGGTLLAFENGEWMWQRSDRSTPECAGTYRIVDDILRLGVERGSFCRGVTLFEAGYSADKAGLRLDPATFAGYPIDLVPFTGKNFPRTEGALSDLQTSGEMR